MKNLLKRLAILALATVWLLGIEFAPAAAPDGGSGSPDNPPTTPPKHSSAAKSTAQQARTAAAPQPRAVRGGCAIPWRLSSYGNPGADDNPAGDDPIVRQAAVDALGNWSGSIVVVDPNTGRILSIVNQKLALSSGFTPCSTFKPIVALAALREGIITPTTKLYVGNRTRMDLTDALARSNNVFFHKLGEMLGFKRITEYAQEFGLGEKAGLDIPGESAGHYPSAPPKEGGVGFLAYCGTDVEVTALQMAAVISTIANGGTLYALQYPRTPEELAAFQPVVRRRLDNLAEYIPADPRWPGGSRALRDGPLRLRSGPFHLWKNRDVQRKRRAPGLVHLLRGRTPTPVCGRGPAARRANDVRPARGGNRRALLSRPDAKGTPHASQPRRIPPALASRR